MRQPIDPLRLATTLQRRTANLWASLSRLEVEHNPARVLFVGAEPQVGTTSLAACTALGLVRNLRTQVGVIEANLARPFLATLFELPKYHGITDVLDGRVDRSEVFHTVDAIPDLRILHAGTARPSMPGEFASDRAVELFKGMDDCGSYLLIDSPPLAEHPESRLLLQDADAAILVLRARSTRREDAEETLALLEEANVPVLGSVLNRFRPETFFRRAG
jgi:Mrp family chromosome partitioning ATPase